MILKISLRAKAGVPKTLAKQKFRLHSLYFPQATSLCRLSLAGNSVICILFLDFARFAIATLSAAWIETFCLFQVCVPAQNLNVRFLLLQFSYLSRSAKGEVDVYRFKVNSLPAGFNRYRLFI